jgi:hypothetical protein
MQRNRRSFDVHHAISAIVFSTTENKVDEDDKNLSKVELYYHKNKIVVTVCDTTATPRLNNAYSNQYRLLNT